MCGCRYLVEEEGPAGGPGEAGRDELGAVGEDGVTVGTGEETRASNVVQKDPPHHAWTAETHTHTHTHSW